MIIRTTASGPLFYLNLKQSPYVQSSGTTTTSWPNCTEKIKALKHSICTN
jgi:hypothetical protein